MDGPYAVARAQAEAQVRRALPTGALKRMHARCRALAEKPAVDVLYAGLGWGALEARRDSKALPAHLTFPESTLGETQAPWLALLNGKPFKTCDTFMTAAPWVALLAAAPRKTAAMLICLGTAHIERGNTEAARNALEAALAMADAPMAHRNLAWLALRGGQAEEAVRHMKRAITVPMPPDALRPYAEEYIALLANTERHGEAFAFFLGLPDGLRTEERLRLCVLQSALMCGEDEFVARQLHERFSVVREGEVLLSEIWFQTEARRLAAQTGEPVTEALVQTVRETALLPAHLDFRMESPGT
jgi:tetratricopeptide (TPR) repeat protein